MWITLGKLLFRQSPLICVLCLLGYCWYLSVRVDVLKADLSAAEQNTIALEKRSESLAKDLEKAIKDNKAKIARLSAVATKKESIEKSASEIKQRIVKSDDENISSGLMDSVKYVSGRLWDKKP